jgi:hypothetical protein
MYQYIFYLSIYFVGPSQSSPIPSPLVLAFDAGRRTNIVVIAIIIAAVTIAVIIVPVAVVALAFMLRCPLVLSSCNLVVACCFYSVTGIFAAHPSFGWLLCLPRIAVVVQQMIAWCIAKKSQWKTTMSITKVAHQKMMPHIPLAVRLKKMPPIAMGGG